MVQYNNKSLLHHIKSGIMWASTGFLTATLATFAHISYLSNTLKPEELGVYFLLLSFSVFISSIASLGLPEALIKTIAKSHRTDSNSITSNNMFAMLLVVLCCCVLSLLLAVFAKTTIFKWFNIPWSPTDLALICLWFSLLSIQLIQSAVFRSIHDIKNATFFGNSLRPILYLLFSILAAQFFGPLNLSLVLYSVVLALFCNNILAYYHRKKTASKNSLRWRPSRSDLDILSLSLPLLANTLALLFIARIGLWTLGYHSTKETVALYGAATQMAALITMPLLIINAFAMPLVADMFHNEDTTEKLQRVLRSITTLVVIPIIGLYLVLIFFGKDIMALIFGETYRDGYIIMILIATGQITNLMAGPCGLILKMTNHHNLLLKLNYSFGLATLIGSLSVAPYFGAPGVAAVVMLAFAFQNIISLRLSILKTNINPATFINPLQLTNLYNDVLFAINRKSK